MATMFDTRLPIGDGMTGDRQLWCMTTGSTEVACWMISCCSGAELQLVAGETTILRELYPTKSDLYERARMLEADYRRQAQPR